MIISFKRPLCLTTPSTVLSIAGLLFLLVSAMSSLGPQAASAQTFTILHSFKVGDGYFPMAAVTFDKKGNLFGTTLGGSAGASLYEINPKGTERVLHFFTASEGSYPESTPLFDSAGNLYGTSSDGGSFNEGTIWTWTTSSRLLDLWAFGQHGTVSTGGVLPLGGLVRDRQGDLYGTAFYGGDTGCGTVYRISSSGAFAVLHAFDSAPDGCWPVGPLLIGTDGKLYGGTNTGGAFSAGAIVKVDPNTGSESVVYSFPADGTEGTVANGGLVQDAEGNIYGTTYSGGVYQSGTIYRFSPTNGTLTTLYSFGSVENDGALPVTGVTRDQAGNLYGTTYAGGGYMHYGVAYKLTASGAYTILHSFLLSTDGGYPWAGVTLHGGALYGTTTVGGDPVCNCGVVFTITP